MKTKNEKRKTKNKSVKCKTLTETGRLTLIIIASGFALFALHFTLVSKAVALTMSGPNWIIESGDFVTSGGRASDAKHNITGALGKTGLGTYIGKNYKVQTGFSRKKKTTEEAFSFSISDNTIDFGPLSATNPVARTSILTLSNPANSGYQVVGYEDGQLVNESSVAINDTTCDNGSCTEKTAAPWTSNLTYGFGYRCDSIDNIICDTTFAGPEYYRQFADIKKNEAPQAIVAGKGGGQNRKAKITYKINISGTQMPGNYSNTITYIAAPTY